MTERKPTVTRPDFEELIGRALAIQDRAGERVELERARAIAMELGVSPEAWEEALTERRLAAEAAAQAPAQQSAPATGLPKPLAITALATLPVRALAVTGASLGFASALIASRLGDVAIPLGVAGYALGCWLALETARRDTQGVRVRVAAWWTSVTIGMIIGIGGPHPDPIAYGVVGWALGDAVAWLVRRFQRT
jgi:hypothetical protein